MKKNNWSKGRGKLGFLKPLLGTWVCETQTERGLLSCTRTFEPILAGKFIQLTVSWQFKTSLYEEHCLIGLNQDKNIAFWSFTNDGKQSQGLLADVSDIHADAIGFEAHMPAGIARQIYWPNDEGGFNWSVESKTQKGWNRFVEHHYKLNE